MRVAPVYFRYVFDPRTETVVGENYTFEDILMPDAAKGTSRIVLEKIVAFDFEYYSYDPKAKVYRWGSQWNKDCFPKTVKITIESEQTNHRKWIRMIPLPTEIACPA